MLENEKNDEVVENNEEDKNDEEGGEPQFEMGTNRSAQQIQS